MAHRSYASALSHTAAALLVLVFSHTAAFAQPVVTSVVSRLTHGAAGTFDVPLPQSGAGGIESRSATGGLRIVVGFDKTVTAGAAAMAAGNTFATVNGPATFSGNTMTVNLAGVQNARTIALTLTGVTDSDGGVLPTAEVSFRTLEGDVNASGAVSAADVNLVTANVNKAVTYANFRADVSVTNGIINPSDTALVKAKINTNVGPAAPNTPPTLAALADQVTPVNTALPSVTIGVGDAESSADMLSVVATSSNGAIVPNAGLVVTGTGSTRTLSITPAADATGVVTVSVRVSDGVLTTTGTFALNVGAAQKLYLADLRQITPTLKTRGNGVMSILLSADETQAVVRLSYNNLTSNKTGAEVRGPALPGQSGNQVFNLNSAVPKEDGSVVWVLGPVNGMTVAELKDALRAGRMYGVVNTATNPAGELRGQFYLATGSQNFTPPPPPPAIVNGTPDQDAARFLIQATFGPSAADIDALKNLPGGINAWLDQQFAKPTTSMLEIMKARVQQAPPNVYAMSGSNIYEIWWNIALKGEDQLRQRVALALSEIFVVSRVEEAIDAQPPGLASYHDMLANNAFGNFRKLLEDVTLHPIMGQYLNMKGNKKQSGTGPLPNENYAREILQLFSVGVDALHPDGTLRLGPDGGNIPSYGQSVIENFAHVFTGWDLASSTVTFPYWDTGLQPAPGISTYSTRWINPMTVNSGNHEFKAKALLDGFTIPARSQSTANANLDLKEALDNIFKHPNTGPFICKQLIQRLVTAQPSPAYVFRVAEVFRDNGSGVRGDMKAVVRAIMTDYEARSVDVIGNSTYGRLKEPILRASHVIRALHPFSNAAAPLDYWRLTNTDPEFLQTVYRSPTVFNFFEPVYLINVKRFGGSTPYFETINSPEMQITNENTVVSIASFFRKGLIDGSGFSSTTDVRINLAAENALCTSTTNSAPIIAVANKVFLAGNLPSLMQTQLDTYYRSRTNAADSAIRCRGVIYLTVTSPFFAVQK